MELPDKIVVNVTDEHINDGTKKCGTHCPIALAVAPFKQPFVAGSWMGVYLNGQRAFYDLPDEAQKFIRSFDKGEPVAPFTFEATLDRLTIPIPS